MWYPPRVSGTTKGNADRHFSVADLGWIGFTLFVLLFQGALTTGIGALVVGAYLWNGLYLLAGLLLLRIAYGLHRLAMRMFTDE